jgi:predicted HTH domain antitoxin
MFDRDTWYIDPEAVSKFFCHGDPEEVVSPEPIVEEVEAFDAEYYSGILNRVRDHWLKEEEVFMLGLLVKEKSGRDISFFCKKSKVWTSTKVKQLLKIVRCYCWFEMNEEIVRKSLAEVLTENQVKVLKCLEVRISTTDAAMLMGMSRNCLKQHLRRSYIRMARSDDLLVKKYMLFLGRVFHGKSIFSVKGKELVPRLEGE